MGTLAVGSGGQFLGVFTATLLNPLILLADRLDTLAARSRDRCNIAIVGVNADKRRDTVGLDVLDDHIAGSAIVAAIPASSV